MRLKHAAVPAAALALSFGALMAPADAAPRAGLHCADYTSPDKVELSGDRSTVYVGENVDSVCLKAGPADFEDVDVINGYITSPNRKGISYYIPTECTDPYGCDGGSEPSS